MYIKKKMPELEKAVEEFLHALYRTDWKSFEYIYELVDVEKMVQLPSEDGNADEIEYNTIEVFFTKNSDVLEALRDFDERAYYTYMKALEIAKKDGVRSVLIFE